MEEIKHLKLIAGLCQAIFRHMWHFLTLFFFCALFYQWVSRVTTDALMRVTPTCAYLRTPSPHAKLSSLHIASFFSAVFSYATTPRFIDSETGHDAGNQI